MTEQTQSSASDSAPNLGASPAASPAASAPTTTSPVSTAPPSPAERPAYVPETFWKDGKVADKEFGDYVAQLATRAAAEDSRKLTLPKAATEYRFDMPKDFVAPPGVEFKLNEADPLLAQAREIALKRGMDQETFSELLGLYAGSQVATQAQVKAARDAEIGKLGPTGPARIDALARFFTSYLGEGEGKGVMARIFTASDVQNLEKLVQKVTSGSAAFTAGGREPPPASGRVSNEQFAKMSAAERLDYARKFDQSQFASRAN